MFPSASTTPTRAEASGAKPTPSLFVERDICGVGYREGRTSYARHEKATHDYDRAKAVLISRHDVR